MMEFDAKGGDAALIYAEIEFSVLARACLRGRNPDEASLEQSINACVTERNATPEPINWSFTIRNARAKLRRLYPDTSTLTDY